MSNQSEEYVDSWKKNPFENLATGGTVAAYKGATAGTDAPTSTSLGVPELFPGASKVKGFDVPKSLEEANMQAIQRQAAIGNGTGESVTEQQYRIAMDRLAKNQTSVAASARGVSNVGLLQDQLARQTQQAGLDINREMVAQRLQEQNAANQFVGQQYAAARGLQFQQNASNQTAQANQRGQNLQLLGNIGAGIATGGLSAGAPKTDSFGGTTQYSQDYINSDENLKKDISPSGGDASRVISEFMNALKSYTYEYKDKADNGIKNPEGKVTSVMAQDLEKTKMGRNMVKDGPDGKMVDYAQGMAPLFAAIAELNQRTKHLKKEA